MKSADRQKLFRQIAALPFRPAPDGTPEVLLVTTRESGRWVIPKGWPMRGRADWKAAAIEAMEEAGALGQIEAEPIGRFAYFKRRERHFDLLEVTVYKLAVTGQLDDWPERKEREIKWFSAAHAAELVQEPGLSALLMSLYSSR